MRPHLDGGGPTVYPWEIQQYGSSSKTLHGVRIGAYTASYWSSCFDGDVAEILIYGDYLDSSDRATVIDYLNAKYIPEPSSSLLLGLGALFLLSRRRRARSAD